MKKSALIFGLFLALALVLACCAPKKPAGPPQELVDEIGAAESVYHDLSALNPSDQNSASYRALIADAKGKLDAGDYKGAMAKARAAHLEAERLYARLVYAELEKYHPPTPLTYHYRQGLKSSDDAQKAGDIPGAIKAAQDAREQARLALQLQKQCMDDMAQRLAGLKNEIELLYKPNLDLILLYWDSMDSLPQLDCEKSKAMVNELARWVAQFKANTIAMQRVYYVNASFDYIKMYGDPYMYGEVTPDGKLKTRVDQVQVGQPLTFIRSMLFSRDKTLYFVEDQRNGVEGWMAEERVWPERAMQH
ncbi:MAG TPA: hypothetical protein VM658_10550 [bacterium]|nr:hypothetical protein [bacterium]